MVMVPWQLKLTQMGMGQNSQIWLNGIIILSGMCVCGWVGEDGITYSSSPGRHMGAYLWAHS